MVRQDAMLNRELDSLKRFLLEKQFEQGIVVIRGGVGSMLSEFTRLLGSQRFVSNYHEDPATFSLVDVLDLPEDGEKRFVCVNCIARFDSTENPVERVVIQAYDVLKARGDVKPILCMDDYTFYMLPDWCMQHEIPTFLFKEFPLDSLDDEAFLTWFGDQFPCHIDKGALETIIDGTGRDLDRALLVRNAFFDREGTRLFFLTPQNDKVRVGFFMTSGKRNALVDDDGAFLHVPVRFFIFDSSALLSPKVGKFINHIRDGSYIIPPFILDEVHGVEERLKKEGETVKTALVKSNLNLLRKRLDHRSFAHRRQRVGYGKIDNQLIRIANETSSIVVTGDKMIVEHCAQIRVPVILFASD